MKLTCTIYTCYIILCLNSALADPTDCTICIVSFNAFMFFYLSMLVESLEIWQPAKYVSGYHALGTLRWWAAVWQVTKPTIWSGETNGGERTKRGKLTWVYCLLPGMSSMRGMPLPLPSVPDPSISVAGPQDDRNDTSSRHNCWIV